MDKIKILMVSEDELLLDAMSLSFFKEYKRLVSIDQISEHRYFEFFLATIQNFDMVIVDIEWYEKVLFEKHAVQTLILLSADAEDADKYPEACVLDPFLGMRELYTSINSRLLLNETLKSALNRSTKVMMFYSPAGGSGTTTVALDYCKELSCYGKKVLYMNTEQLQSHGYLVKEGDVASSRFVSQIQRKVQTEDLEIEVHKNANGFDVMLPLKAPLFYLNVELKMLIECAQNIKKQNVYDYIVLDAESGFSEDKMLMLEISNQVILLASGVDKSLIKLEKLVENITCSNGSFHFFITNTTSASLEFINRLVSKAQIDYTLSGPFDMLNEKEEIKIYDYAIKNLGLKIQ